MTYIGSTVVHELYDEESKLSYLRIKGVWYVYNRPHDCWSHCRERDDKILETALRDSQEVQP